MGSSDKTIKYPEMGYAHGLTLGMIYYTNLPDLDPWQPYGHAGDPFFTRVEKNSDAGMVPFSCVDTFPYTAARVTGLCQNNPHSILDSLASVGFQFYAAPIFYILGTMLLASQYVSRARAWSSKQIAAQLNEIRAEAGLPLIEPPTATAPQPLSTEEEKKLEAAKLVDAETNQKKREDSCTNGVTWLLCWLDGAIFKNLNRALEVAADYITDKCDKWSTPCANKLRQWGVYSFCDKLGQWIATAVANALYYPPYWLFCGLRKLYRWASGYKDENKPETTVQNNSEPQAQNNLEEHDPKKEFLALFARAYARIKKNRFYDLFFGKQQATSTSSSSFSSKEEEISHFRKFCRKLNDAFWRLFNYVFMYSFIYWIWIYSSALHYGPAFYSFTAQDYSLFLFAGSFASFVVICPIIGYWLINYFIPKWAKLYYNIELDGDTIGQTLGQAKSSVQDEQKKVDYYEDFKRSGELGYISQQTKMAILIQQTLIETQREAKKKKLEKLQKSFAGIFGLVALSDPQTWQEYGAGYVIKEYSPSTNQDSSGPWNAPQHIQGALAVLKSNSSTYDVAVFRFRAFISSFVGNFITVAFALWPVGDFLGFLISSLASGDGANWIALITCWAATALGLWEGFKAQSNAGLVAERNAKFAKKLESQHFEAKNGVPIENEIIACIWQREQLRNEILSLLARSQTLSPDNKTKAENTLNECLTDTIYDPESDPNTKTLRYLEKEPWYDHGIGLFLICSFIFEYRLFTGILFMRFWFIPGSFASALAWLAGGSLMFATQPVMFVAIAFGICFALYKVWEYLDNRRTNNAYAKTLSVINSVEAQEAELQSLKATISLLEEARRTLQTKPTVTALETKNSANVAATTAPTNVTQSAPITMTDAAPNNSAPLDVKASGSSFNEPLPDLTAIVRNSAQETEKTQSGFYERSKLAATRWEDVDKAKIAKVYSIVAEKDKLRSENNSGPRFFAPRATSSSSHEMPSLSHQVQVL